MEKITCKTCVHFRQHYGISEGRIFRIHCGHCTFPKVRTKRPDANACQHYTLAPPDEDAFVSREYLTKSLLQYLLTLELLPTIADSPMQKI